MAENVTTTISVDPAMFPKGAKLVAKVEQVTLDGAPTGTFEVTITAEEKRYVLPMEGTDRFGASGYAYVDADNIWDVDWYDRDKDAVNDDRTVTQADIDAAPAWVQAIKPVEVTDHE